MTSVVQHLQLPLTCDAARALFLGDLVTVSGIVFTGRSQFHIRAVEDHVLPPLDFAAINCFFHAGPVMRRVDDDWEIVSVEPTSSIRFERYSPDVVRQLGLRTLIGKTTMGLGTAEALREVGGVHLTKIGLCGNALAAQVKCIQGVHFVEELGKTEATWVFEVERFGPFFVDMDAHGQNYFEELDADMRGRMETVYAEMGVSPSYTYTDVSAVVSPERNAL